MLDPSNGGAMGDILRVNLTTERVGRERLDENVVRNYIGGLGIGAKILYDEVPPEASWSDEANRLIFAAGPLNGTAVPGSGTICAVTKGCLTQGCSSSQANGYFGAYLKTSGVDALVIEGRASEWKYLCIQDDTAELRDASPLKGMDTIETERWIKKEHSKKPGELSAYAIGLAGENKVKYAMIFGDEGHVMAHNGFGAVMGSKKLKAIAVKRGRIRPAVLDKEGLTKIAREIGTQARNHPIYGRIHQFGTSMLWNMLIHAGLIPVRNLTTNIFPDFAKFSREHYGKLYEMKRVQCWACPLHHVQHMKIGEKGIEVKEPEYECTAAWGSLIGNENFESAVLLSDLADRLGLDSNEAGWTIAFAIECYEKGILTPNDTDGLQMTWGNVEAVREMLHRISRREGIGNLLAEGVKRAAEQIGGEALNLGVYVNKGHSPRTHDARARWSDILDYATANVGTSESNSVQSLEPFSPKEVASCVVKGKVRQFVDSLVVCNIATMSYAGTDVKNLIDALNVVMGWSFTEKDAMDVSLRITNLARAFNIRCGITPECEVPSPKYGSIPVDGPAKGKNISPVWEDMVTEYYRLMGWDRSSGKPKPDTLKKLGLEAVIADIW
jgi:aldehyde:ferredoxin oxidoreductase